MRTVIVVLTSVAGVYLILRAIVELVSIDYSDPSSYASDWGGPSLAGILVVHAGPGLLAALAMLIARRRSRKNERDG